MKGRGKGRGRKTEPKAPNVEGEVPGLLGKRTSCPWINSQIIQASKEDNGIQRILGVVEMCINDMNLVNLSTSLHRLAKLSVVTPHSDRMLRQSPIMKLLLASIATAFCAVEQDPSLPQSLSNITWSLATLRIIDYKVLELAGNLAVANMKDFKAFELASLLWSFAKLGTADTMTPVVSPLFRAATGRLMACVPGAGFRSLATAAWAFATARQASQRLFRAIAKEVQTCLPTANSQELANIVWAYGTVGHRDDQLFRMIAEECVPRLEEFKTQELSNTFWGFASNDFHHEAFYHKALLLAQGMQLQPQHVANILWAAARLQRKHPAARQAALHMVPGCLGFLTSFKPQEVASTAHAVAKIFSAEADGCEFHGQPMIPLQISMFFSAITPWCQEHIESFSDQSLANIVSSFGMLRINLHPSFLASVERQVLERLKASDYAALVVFFRATVQCPQLARLEAQLAATLAQELVNFKSKELRSLAFTRSLKLGIVHQDTEPNVEELHRWCVELARSTPQEKPDLRKHGEPDQSRPLGAMEMHLEAQRRQDLLWQLQATQAAQAAHAQATQAAQAAQAAHAAQAAQAVHAAHAAQVAQAQAAQAAQAVQAAQQAQHAAQAAEAQRAAQAAQVAQAAQAAQAAQVQAAQVAGVRMLGEPWKAVSEVSYPSAASAAPPWPSQKPWQTGPPIPLPQACPASASSVMSSMPQAPPTWMPAADAVRSDFGATVPEPSPVQVDQLRQAPEVNVLTSREAKRTKALERASDPRTWAKMSGQLDFGEDDDLFSFQWPEGVPRTEAGLAASMEFRSASRSCGGCGEDIFNELKQELQHPLNTGFATPTQSTDLSFLSQMRQKLLQSKADRPEDLSQSLGCDSTSFALTERSRHELNRQKLMQGADGVRPMSLQPIDLDEDTPLHSEGLRKIQLDSFCPQEGTLSMQSVAGIVTGDLDAISMNLQ